MKKIVLLIAIVFVFSALQAQDYFVSFEASGASTTITSLRVENRTKGISATLSGNDILHLSGITGLNPLKEEGPFRIKTSPNPMPGQCKIDFQTLKQGPATIELYNVSGKLILQKTEQLDPGNHVFRLSGLKSGVYILKLTSDTKTCSAKIVSNNSRIDAAGMERISSSPVSGNAAHKPDAGMKKGIADQKSEVVLAYDAGDFLLLKAYAGIYTSYSVLDPTFSPTHVIPFYKCIDAGGESYPVAHIGSQFWTAKNLKSTVLNDGTPLSDNKWAIADSAAYCTYLNTKNQDTINAYGRLYNWYAVNTGKLCPVGWHVPKQDDWTLLTNFLGGRGVGGKLKETGTAHWLSPNETAIDLYGFSAVAGGWRSYESTFSFMKKYGLYWSATQAGTNHGNVWMLEYDNDNFMSDPSSKKNGFSVRCVKD